MSNIHVGDTVFCRFTGEEFTVVGYDGAALVTLSDGSTRIIGDLLRKPAAKDNKIHFGSKSYEILFARWDSSRQIGLIQVRDNDGEFFIVESDGLAPNEQRQAVAAKAAIIAKFGKLLPLGQPHDAPAMLSGRGAS